MSRLSALARSWTWTGTVVVLSLAAGAARADGVRVLDEMEGARTDLFVSTTAAEARLQEILLRTRTPGLARAERVLLKKEAAALRKVMLPAARALAALDVAVPALKRNDMAGFFKATTLASAQMHLTVKAGEKLSHEAWMLDPACTQNLAAALRTTLAEANTLAGPGAKPQPKDPVADGLAKEAKGLYGTACRLYVGGLAAQLETPIAAGAHDPVVLRGLNGQPVNLAISVAPYSPKQTCGACHDYATITKGYHFDQGKKVVRDDYAVGRDNTPPYVLSDGMFGKW